MDFFSNTCTTSAIASNITLDGMLRDIQRLLLPKPRPAIVQPPPGLPLGKASIHQAGWIFPVKADFYADNPDYRSPNGLGDFWPEYRPTLGLGVLMAFLEPATYIPAGPAELVIETEGEATSIHITVLKQRFFFYTVRFMLRRDEPTMPIYFDARMSMSVIAPPRPGLYGAWS